MNAFVIFFLFFFLHCTYNNRFRFASFRETLPKILNDHEIAGNIKSAWEACQKTLEPLRVNVKEELKYPHCMCIQMTRKALDYAVMKNPESLYLKEYYASWVEKYDKPKCWVYWKRIKSCAIEVAIRPEVYHCRQYYIDKNEKNAIEQFIDTPPNEETECINPIEL